MYYFTNRKSHSFDCLVFKVFIKGHNIRESVDIACRMIGYCPQHDALWSSLTIREHLHVYAIIRGISKDQVQK